MIDCTTKSRKEPVLFNFTIDFEALTIKGLGEPTEITDVSQTAIKFGGPEWGGEIDRMRGEVSALRTTAFGFESILLKCKPAQRMF